MIPLVDYRSIAKPNTFIGDYLVAMENQETPRAYDFWCACWLMSLALGRNMQVLRPRAPVFLNMYAVLAAEAGTTRKSTAVRHASNIAREFLNLDQTQFIMIEGKATPEKVEAMLHEQSRMNANASCAIAISEMVTFFGKERYNQAMPGLLTDLYDCPSYRAGGSVTHNREIKNAYVSLLTASTPSWLIRAINPDVIEGGFTSRCLFIVEERSKRSIPWPEHDNSEQILASFPRRLGRLREKSEEVRRVFGGITISDAARRHFSTWYTRREQTREPYGASFAAREDHHVLRVAAYLSVNDDGWIIQHHHIESAIRLVARAKESGASLFSGSLSASKFVLGIDKVRSYLINGGNNGRTQSELTIAGRPYINAEQLRIVLGVMHELEMVQRFDNVQLSGRGRPITIWRGTSRLSARSATDIIAKKIDPTS